MRFLFLFSLGILLFVTGCATTRESTYNSTFYDQRPWLAELSFDNEDTMSDFEILDISPSMHKEWPQNLDVIKDDLSELVKP